MGLHKEVVVKLYCDWCQQEITGNSRVIIVERLVMNFHTEEEKAIWIEEHTVPS